MASRITRAMRSMTALGPRSALVLLFAPADEFELRSEDSGEDLGSAQIDAEIHLFGSWFRHVCGVVTAVGENPPAPHVAAEPVRVPVGLIHQKGACGSNG